MMQLIIMLFIQDVCTFKTKWRCSICYNLGSDIGCVRLWLSCHCTLTPGYSPSCYWFNLLPFFWWCFIRSCAFHFGFLDCRVHWKFLIDNWITPKMLKIHVLKTFHGHDTIEIVFVQFLWNWNYKRVLSPALNVFLFSSNDTTFVQSLQNTKDSGGMV